MKCGALIPPPWVVWTVVAIALAFCALVVFATVVDYRRFEHRRARHEALVRWQREQWAAANPHLVARGVPAPPTPESMTTIRYGWL